MRVDGLSRQLAGIPHMTPEQGRAVTDFVCEHGLRFCLELGFAHGVGTAYLANAVDRLGDGRVTSIDLDAARQRQPDIYTTLERAGLDPKAVEIYFEPLSYNWRLMQFLEDGRAGTFDFVYLDGAHAWEPDGLAFYLSEKLLRPGGWILFDDLNWTLDSPTMRGFDWVQRLPAEVRQTPQIRKVWDLLVKTDNRFDELIERDDWAFARKAPEPAGCKVIYRYHPLAEPLLAGKHLVRRALHRLRR